MNHRSLGRSLLAYGLAPAVGLITAPILARSLGVEGRGQLAAILQPLSLADMVAVIGVPSAVAFYIARGDDVKRVTSLALKVAAVSSLAIYAVLVWYSGIVTQVQELNRFFVCIVWFAVIPGAILATRRAAWSGLSQWKLIDGERSLFAASRLGTISVLGLLGVSAVFIFAAAPIVTGVVISAVLLGRRLPDKGGPRPEAARFLRFSLSSSAAMIATAASGRLDQTLLPALVDSRNLGLYSVSVTVADVLLIVGTVAARNLLSEAASGMRIKRMGTTLLTLMLMAFVMVLVLFVTIPWVIPALFGSDFAEAVAPTNVRLFAVMFIIVTMAFSAVLTGWGRPLLAAVAPVIATAAQVLLFAVFAASMTAVLAAQIVVAASALAFISALICLFIGVRLRRVGSAN